MSLRKISSSFLSCDYFLPSVFAIMLLCINSTKSSCSATWSLTLYVSLISLLIYPDHFCSEETPLLLLLHDLDSLLLSAFHHTFLAPTPSAPPPPLHISYSSSLLTPEACMYTQLCMLFTPGSWRDYLPHGVLGSHLS